MSPSDLTEIAVSFGIVGLQSSEFLLRLVYVSVVQCSVFGGFRERLAQPLSDCRSMHHAPGLITTTQFCDYEKVWLFEYEQSRISGECFTWLRACGSAYWWVQTCS